MLSSDLGGGKTTFTKGLAAGLGSEDHVGSPTFTVSRVYRCRDGIYLHHFDFYRLAEAGVVGHELADVIGDPHAVTVIEWGDVVSDVLPADRIMIQIDRLPGGEELRCLNVTSPPGLSYVYNDVIKEKNHAHAHHKKRQARGRDRSV